ncbi:MAG TPA: PepSY domain-containing protein [Acidiferrobacterales bacterium]|nr:PepSY domain-containing protein [Acidiferrobacterales bacterium]
MPKRILALLLVAAALLTAGAPSVTFASGGGHSLIARRGGGEAGVSLNDAVQQVRRETGGRVLSADTVNQGGRTVHRIKVLTPSGQVRIVTIDAQSKGR